MNHKLVTKANAVGTKLSSISVLLSKTQYESCKQNKVPDINNLVTKAAFNKKAKLKGT